MNVLHMLSECSNNVEFGRYLELKIKAIKNAHYSIDSMATTNLTIFFHGHYPITQYQND